jgi:hypothetical protein
MKKLISIISIIIVFIVLPCLIIYHLGSVNFINNFLNNQMIPLMGTIMALNFAIATSLQSILLNIETIKNETLFPHTKNEINQNLMFIIIVFIIVFILQVINIPMRKIFLYPLMGAKLTLFFIYFYAIYDLNSALFKISKKG